MYGQGYPIVGHESIVGASAEDQYFGELVSGEDIVGATPGAGPVRMVQRRPQERRRFLAPVPATTIAANAEADVTIQPQRDFRVERIIVPSSIAANFSFRDIKVGQQSQLLNAGQLPCEAFSEVAIDCYVLFDTANIGNVIALSVVNLDTVNPQTFRAMLLGTAVK